MSLISIIIERISKLKKPYWIYDRLAIRSWFDRAKSIKSLDRDIWLPKFVITNLHVIMCHVRNANNQVFEGKIYVTESFVNSMVKQVKYPVPTRKLDRSQIQSRALTFLNSINKMPGEDEVKLEPPPTALP